MFLRSLLEKVDKFDPSKAPVVNDRVGKTDVVVGEMTPELIKLYGVISEEGTALAELGTSLMAKTEELGKNITGAQLDQFSAEYGIARDRFTALQKLLWAEIKDAFPALGGHEQVGIREGFKLVIINDAKCNCPSCMAARILGIIG